MSTHKHARYIVVDAPSILGLRPSGVERLPEALRAGGLLDALDADDGGAVPTLPYNTQRDDATGVLNPSAIRDFSISLADALSLVIADGRFPIVLGGDCSIVIGAMLALRRAGRFGLFFIDGHADFYQPEASLTGEVADMDLAIVSGHGPDVLTNVEGRRPLVREQDIVLFGYRDAAEAAEYGSQDVRETAIHVFDLGDVRAAGAADAGRAALSELSAELAGIWVHLDVDVLDDEVMPAVDYRMPGGVSFGELGETLGMLRDRGGVVGMSIAIFNPTLDVDGSMARSLVECIAGGLRVR